MSILNIPKRFIAGLEDLSAMDEDEFVRGIGAGAADCCDTVAESKGQSQRPHGRVRGLVSYAGRSLQLACAAQSRRQKFAPVAG